MTLKTIASQKSLLAKKSASCVELTSDTLLLLESNKAINAFISICGEQAKEQAKLADNAIAQKEIKSLTGIPIAHKDLFCTKGIKTTCGSKILENFVSPYDATIVDQLNQAGTITIGKTNMDEFAMGSSNESSFYGPVDNPWDTSRVPGGSSGGSAAAVAANLVAIATGSDTGGSIRQPASFCNVVGVKPSYGRCSRFGMIAYASSLDQAGIFSHTVEDAAIALNAMSGFDSKDSTSVQIDCPDLTADLNQSLDGLRIGLPKEYFAEGLDDEVASIVQDAIKQYEKMGATVKEVSLPNSKLAIPCYYVIAPAEASSNLSRFDGVRYGYRADEYTDLESMYIKSRTEGFGNEVKRRIMIGAYALSSGYYDAYYAKAQKLRRLISNDFTAVFEECDVIMGPTAPTPAYKKGSKTKDPIEMYLGDIYTIAVNLVGLPAASIPAGFTASGLPVGLQLISPYMQEAKLLNIGHQYQLETDWHTQLPAAFGGES